MKVEPMKTHAGGGGLYVHVMVSEKGAWAQSYVMRVPVEMLQVDDLAELLEIRARLRARDQRVPDEPMF